MIPLLTLLEFNDTVAFSYGVCWADTRQPHSNIYSWCWLLVGASQFLTGWSRSAFQETKDGATRSLKGKP